jgi:rubrerythrin
MELFGKFNDKLSEKSKDMAKIAKDMTGTVILNTKISSCENTIKEAQIQIGKKYFEAYEKDPAPEYKEFFETIIKAKETIERYKEEKRSLKGIHLCSDCGGEVPDNADYCPSCGAKVQKDIQTEGRYTTEVPSDLEKDFSDET